MACVVEHCSWGTLYTVPEDAPKNPKVKLKKAYAPVECWWSDGRVTFLLRQENNDRAADVLELSHGQLYDLIDALNHAIGLPRASVRIK